MQLFFFLLSPRAKITLSRRHSSTISLSFLQERDRLLASQPSPLSEYSIFRAHHQYGAVPNRHRSYCDSNGNKFISESRASTPFSDGRTGSGPGRGDVHREGAEMYTDLDEPSHSGNPSYVTVDKRAPQPPACLSVVGITYTVRKINRLLESRIPYVRFIGCWNHVYRT